MAEIYRSKESYNYKGRDVYIMKSEYMGNDAAALMLSSVDTMELVLTASVNASVNCGTDKCFIKNYSENSGVEEWLIKNNIIGAESLASVPSGFVSLPLYTINLEIFEEFE